MALKRCRRARRKGKMEENLQRKRARKETGCHTVVGGGIQRESNPNKELRSEQLFTFDGLTRRKERGRFLGECCRHGRTIINL